jgi:hypothetical protein
MRQVRLTERRRNKLILPLPQMLIEVHAPQRLAKPIIAPPMRSLATTPE